MLPDALTPMIWPLLKAGKLFHPIFLQQRPLWTAGRLIPIAPTLPWSLSGFAARPTAGQITTATRPTAGQITTATRPTAGQITTATRPTVVHPLIKPAVFWTISGQTRDSTGATLANCQAQLFDTATDEYLGEVTSNSDGYYYLKTTTRSATHYVVAYKAGGADVAGTTVNTLMGT